MVGNYLDPATGTFRAFHRAADGTVTDIDASGRLPGLVGAVLPFGINDDGQIIGIYTDGRGQRHGFLLDDGRFREIRAPGAVFESFTTDIDDQGRILGFVA
jgi:probable HAF family extracellular repeat protein